MEATKIFMIEKYNRNVYTNNYIYGFSMYGNIYYYTLTGLHFIKLDKQSSKNGGGYSLRYKPTKKEKENIIKAEFVKYFAVKIISKMQLKIQNIIKVRFLKR